MSSLHDHMMYKNKLFEFLNRFRIQRGQSYTHTSLNPNGSYFIDKNEDRNMFYNLYYSALKHKCELHILEKPRNQGPIIKDYDIKYEHENNKRLYTLSDVKSIIRINNDLIKEYLDVSITKIKAYVFEKMQPSEIKDKSFKDGFHIIYSDVCITPELQHIIRFREIEKMKEMNWLHHIKKSEDYDKIVDKAVISQNLWYLYGSQKPDGFKYDLTHIFDFNLNEIPIESMDLKSRVINFSIRLKSSKDMTPLNNNFTQDQFLDLCYTLGIYKKTQEIDHFSNFKFNLIDGKKIEKLVNMLKKSRFEHYMSWIEIGWCLHNIDNNFLPLWIEITNKNSPEQFKDGEKRDCEMRWRTFRNEGFNIYSLHKWAREDSQEEYQKFKDEDIDRFIRLGITGTAYDIAKILHEKYKFDYCCASIKHNQWYEYKRHKWHLIHQAHTLRSKVCSEIFFIYHDLYRKISETINSCESKLLNKTYDEQKEKISKLFMKLKTSSFIDSVMKECNYLFYDEIFLERLDENKHLLCFENGVYDLDSDTFRDGMPEDYISLCTKTNYREFKKDDNEMKFISSFTFDVFPDEDMRNYVLTLLASCLCGINKDQKFYIFIGSGANGKSKTIELFMKVMGDYIFPLPPTVVTTKRNAPSAASPEMARTKGRRVGILQEPEQNEQIYVGKMKEITGCDKIMARELYKEPIEFTPQFKLFLVCNNLPTIPSNDDGTWRRIRAILFKSKFLSQNEIKDSKLDKKYVKLMNDNLSNELEKNKEAFMFLLLQLYKKYKKFGIIEPDIVKVMTNKYKQDNDVYLEFINETIDKTNNKSDYVSFIKLFDTYKDWHKSSAITKKISKNEFKTNMEEKLGSMNNETLGWHNIIVKNTIKTESIQEED